jgi:Zn-dependent protease with chaperone function
MMKAEQFHALVQRLEQTARRRPGAYRRRVAFIALLGYGYVWLVLLGVVGALALLTWLLTGARAGGISLLVKVAIPLVVLAGAILRAMWVRFDAPSGLRLVPTQTPAVFGLVHDLATRLRTPRFHEILITFEFNAAVVQTPRLGFLGWYRNSLLLGLPLLEAMSPDEFRAVLAHEMGHLSRQHGRFGAWIYRTRALWIRLTERLESQQHWGYHVFDWFLSRWAPYFSAYSFVLARQHEYEADHFAAEVAGAGNLGRALHRLELLGAYLDQRVWSEVARDAEHLAKPPQGVPARLAAALRQAPADDDAREWLWAALARRTDLGDTHPSLTDRLAALALAPATDGRHVTVPPGRTAAEEYLGPLRPEIESRLDDAWRRDIAPGWAQRHEAMAAARRRLNELTEKARSGSLPVEQALERAALVLDLDGSTPAEPLLREIVDQVPGHAGANWALGGILLGRNDEEGVRLIERAIAADDSARGAGYHLIRRFYERRGDEALARRYQQAV